MMRWMHELVFSFLKKAMKSLKKAIKLGGGWTLPISRSFSLLFETQPNKLNSGSSPN